MVKRRRRYDLEFKIEAVRLSLRGNRTMSEVARDLGINSNMVSRWKRELSEDPIHAFPGHGYLKPEEEKLRRLQRELVDVKEERDILKKALAIFSKRPR